MNYTDWHIMKNEKDGEHEFFYGPLNQFDSDELENLTEIPYEEWSSNDLITIAGNLLEDMNYHSAIDLLDIFNESLNNANLQESTKVIILRTLVEKINNL